MPALHPSRFCTVLMTTSHKHHQQDHLGTIIFASNVSLLYIQAIFDMDEDNIADADTLFLNEAPRTTGSSLWHLHRNYHDVEVIAELI